MKGSKYRLSSKFLAILSIFLFVFIGVWVGVNKWPRSLEDPLWFFDDLKIPNPPPLNAYHSLPKSYELWPVLLPDTLDSWDKGTDFFLRPPYQDLNKVNKFWKEAKSLEPAISEYVKRAAPSMEWYQKFLNIPQLNDRDLSKNPLSLKTDDRIANWDYLLRIHQVAHLFLINQALMDNWNNFTTIWIKMFIQDQSWLRTARSLESFFYALECIEGDLKILIRLKAKIPPENWKEILKLIQNLDAKTFNLKRSLIYEYLSLYFFSWDKENLKKILPWYWRVLFNERLFLSDLNTIYKNLEKLEENPNQITLSSSEILEKEALNDQKEIFWWFYNPAGKTLLRNLNPNFKYKIKMFYERKEGILKTIAILKKE